MSSKMQSRLIKHWQSKGFFVLNLVRVSIAGIPDLIALKPDHVVFIESKEKHDRLSPLQKIRIKMLKKLGFEVYVNYDKC